MKSFTEYLNEVEGRDWNYNLKGSAHFESDKDNMRKAQQVLADADPEMVDEIKAKMKEGSSLPTGKDFEEIYQALFVMNHLATIKKSSKDKDTVGMKFDPDEAAKMVEKFGIEPEKDNPSPLIKKGADIAISKKKSATSSKPIDDKPVEDKPVEDKPKENKPTEEKPTPPNDMDDQKDEEPVETKPTETKPTENKPNKKTPTKPDNTLSTDMSIATSSDDMKNIIQQKIDKIKTNLTKSEEDNDRGRARKYGNMLKDYQKSADKIVNKVRSREDELEADISDDAKKIHKRKIEASGSELRNLNNNIDTQILRTGLRTAGEDIKKGIKDTANKIKQTGENIKNSGKVKDAKRLGSKAVTGMKMALNKAKDTTDTLKNTQTGKAISDKTKIAQEKVKAGIKKADAATADVINKGKNSETVQNISKRAGQVASNVKGKVSGAISGMKEKLNTTKQATSAGVNAARDVATKKAQEEAKKKLQKKFIKNKDDEEKDKVKKAVI